jgi:uncharacterized DUF497 family protein
LQKHGLYFADTNEVLQSSYRWDIDIIRSGERRIQSIFYVMGFLAVLTVVYTNREDATRIISFRVGSQKEREAYYVWLENECDESQ